MPLTFIPSEGEIDMYRRTGAFSGIELPEDSPDGDLDRLVNAVAIGMCIAANPGISADVLIHRATPIMVKTPDGTFPCYPTDSQPEPAWRSYRYAAAAAIGALKACLYRETTAETGLSRPREGG